MDGEPGLLFVLLALLGVLALARRLLGAASRAVLSAAEMAAASGHAESGARRGDLTAMTEGREAERQAATNRRRSLAAAGAYLTWLLVPLLLDAAVEAYAVAASLWVLPSSTVKPKGDPRERQA